MAALQPTLRDARLTGRRVHLRPLAPGDAAVAFDLVHSREEILRWLLWSGPQSVQDMEEWCESWAMPGPDGWNYHFAICEAAGTGEFLGTIGPRFSGHPFLGDLGYWLAERAWGRGLMTEAVFLCAHLCFRHLGSRALTAEVFDGNVGSERVLERNGFRREETPHECRLPDGGRI